MDQYIQFITNHYWLSLSFVMTVGFVVYMEYNIRFAPYESLTPTQAVILQNHEDAIFIDIRESKELSRGKLIDSVHIPLTKFATAGNQLNKHRNKNLIIYCANGNRSRSVCKKLIKQDYKQVFNLTGGINAWQKENFPTTT
ncbi:MAG: rhodanese-like domain-containing protein [Gammaproteobacteria bacterium]|nr:MAG: rhodanese-like domain-containing protein [Gammaproteobacteria bacterium]